MSTQQRLGLKIIFRRLEPNRTKSHRITSANLVLKRGNGWNTFLEGKSNRKQTRKKMRLPTLVWTERTSVSVSVVLA